MTNKIQKKILKNGLTLLFNKNKSKNIYLAFLIKTGGLEEPENKKGIFHFIEHMVYSGTKTRDREKIIHELEKNGGVINGLTSNNSTVHLCTFNKKELYKSLDIILDMLQNTEFSEEEINKERKVILEELKTRKDNKLIYSADSIQKILFKKPFGENVIGTIKTIKSFTRKDLLNWYKKYYVSQNMVLSIIGDFDLNTLTKILNKKITQTKTIFKKKPPIMKTEKKDIFKQKIKQSTLVIGYHAPKTNEKDFYASLVLNSILNEGMSSRLFKNIRNKKNLCYNIFGVVDGNTYFSIGTIFVEAKKQNLDKIENLIVNEFKDISENLSKEELNEVKTKIIKRDELSQEDKKREVLTMLEKENAEIPQDMKTIKKEISKVTLDQIKKLASNFILNGYSRFRLLPKK